jgi:hypothetical protein
MRASARPAPFIRPFLHPAGGPRRRGRAAPREREKMNRPLDICSQSLSGRIRVFMNRRVASIASRSSQSVQARGCEDSSLVLAVEAPGRPDGHEKTAMQRRSSPLSTSQCREPPRIEPGHAMTDGIDEDAAPMKTSATCAPSKSLEVRA